MIYGPAGAVEIWGAKRFALIEDHVKKVQHEGLGIHSEIFLQRTIFPEIIKAGYDIEYEPNICFLRARADQTIWLRDCSNDNSEYITEDQCERVVEETLQQQCKRENLTGGNSLSGVVHLNCNDEK